MKVPSGLVPKSTKSAEHFPWVVQNDEDDWKVRSCLLPICESGSLLTGNIVNLANENYFSNFTTNGFRSILTISITVILCLSAS